MAGQFEMLVTNLLKARFPILYIPTWEEDRAIAALSKIATDKANIKTVRKVFTWAMTTGLLGDGLAPKEDSKASLKVLEMIEKFSEPALFILKDFHIFFGVANRPPDFQVIRRVRDIVPALKSSQSTKNVVLLSPCLVLPSDLQKDVTAVDFDLPTFEEILGILNEMIATNKQSGKIQINITAEDAEKLAKAALGLTVQEAENAFARAMVEDGKLDAEMWK